MWVWKQDKYLFFTILFLGAVQLSWAWKKFYNLGDILQGLEYGSLKHFY